MKVIRDKILDKISKVPEKPGCYFWKDYTGKIIYIGKSKNLRNRLRQYLMKDIDTKTIAMISKAVDFDFIITNSETESLVTESNLINKYKPKYNILFREQISFNYLIITNEKYPRVYIARFFDPKKIILKIGPITDDGYKRKLLIEVINRYYPFRKCKKIPKHKCIYYDLNQCLGPCINKIEPSIYDKYVSEIKDLFKGKNSKLANELTELEKEYSKNLEFEKAKETLDVINIIQDVPKLINISNNEFDVFGFYHHNDIITMSIFEYENNKLIGKFSQTTFMKMDSIKSITEKFIYEYYYEKNIENKTLITSLTIYEDVLKLLNLKSIIPEKNKYHDVVQLAIKNSKSTWEIESLKLNVKYNRSEIAIEELKTIINLDELSLIELYDNSHLFNDAPIGVKVAYVNGEKRNNLYRKFNIRDIEKKSDYDYMHEVISRRFSKILTDDNEIIPNLIIVDGGIIQINAAKKALNKYHLNPIIKVIGLAKNKSHKTSAIIIDNKTRIDLEPRSNIFFLLSEMQDEVHRFAISSFRKRKNSDLYKTELLNIEGIGSKNSKKIFDYFETLENIKNSTIEELQQVVSKKISQRIKDYFSPK